MYKIILFTVLLFSASFSAQGIEYSWENEAGKTINASSLKGKPVLYHFWASWCPPCRKEMPALVKWMGEHPEVTVVVLSLDRSRSGAEGFFEKQGINIPLNMGSMSEASALGVRGLPSTFAVNASGEVTKRHSGDIDWADKNKSQEVLSWL